MSRPMVVETVATNRATLVLSMTLIAKAVARAAAAVFTRLLLSKTVASSLSGRSISLATRRAPGLPVFTRCMRRTRDRATKAVSEPEKKADNSRQAKSNTSFHISVISIYGRSFFAGTKSWIVLECGS